MSYTRMRFSIEAGIARLVFTDVARHHAVDRLFTQELAQVARARLDGLQFLHPVSRFRGHHARARPGLLRRLRV